MPGKFFQHLKPVLLLLLFFSVSTALLAQDKKAKGQQVQKDGVTAYIVRDDSSSDISLTMLIAHKTSFTSRVCAVLGKEIVPLVFSVSTLPHKVAWFDPARLRFEQQGKVWQPDSTKLDDAMIFIGDDKRFGGMIASGEIHQAVLLLPDWFDVAAPIFVSYHRAARTIPVYSQISVSREKNRGR